MSVDSVKIAVQSGVALVCATCSKFWEGQSAGSPVCTGVRCGSPIKGLSFPEYSGPIPEEKFAEWCFVCGNASDHLVMVRGMHRKIGVCDKHFVLLVDLPPAEASNIQIVRLL